MAARPRLAPLPDPGPGFLGRILEAAPVWAITSEQRELRLVLIRALLHQGAARPDFTAAAQALLFLAFQEDPLDAATLALLNAVQAARPFLPARATAMLCLLRAAPPLPPDDVRFEDILASGDLELRLRYLAIAAKDHVAALSRLAPAFTALCRLPDAGLAQDLLAAFAPNLPPSL